MVLIQCFQLLHLQQAAAQELLQQMSLTVTQEVLAAVQVAVMALVHKVVLELPIKVLQVVMELQHKRGKAVVAVVLAQLVMLELLRLVQEMVVMEWPFLLLVHL
jgi:hypothetical protein